MNGRNSLLRPVLASVFTLALLIGLAGCGGSDAKTPAARRPASEPPASPKTPATTASRERTPAKPTQELPVFDSSRSAAETSPPLRDLPIDDRRSLAELLDDEPENERTPATAPRLPADQRGASIPIDDAKAAVAGIRKLASRHITLYTDLPQQPAVDELPDVFDLAVPLWCEYFNIDPLEVADWHITAFLMQEKRRFQGAGLYPTDLPPFPNGYQRGAYFWLYDQTDDFYRRELMLHEGTHAFMSLILGSLGPSWYAEGMAEFLGTHRWDGKQLTLAYLPKDKAETPGWGRIKIVQDELAAGRGMLPTGILNYGPQAHLENAPYGWCWAFATFLDKHPKSQAAFRALRNKLGDADFTGAFTRELTRAFPDLNEQWQVFVVDLDYGYDVQRAAIVRKPTVVLPAGGATVTIAADRGWQSTGILLDAGKTYQLTAVGRYQVGETTEPWWCEPGGVTIHYHQSRPLGMLLGAIRDDSKPLDGLSPLTSPEPVGLQRAWTPDNPGTLYLKINEAASGLADNEGQLTIHIEVTTES